MDEAKPFLIPKREVWAFLYSNRQTIFERAASLSIPAIYELPNESEEHCAGRRSQALLAWWLARLTQELATGGKLGS
jgi:hypothetical protein